MIKLGSVCLDWLLVLCAITQELYIFIHFMSLLPHFLPVLHAITQELYIFIHFMILLPDISVQLTPLLGRMDVEVKVPPAEDRAIKGCLL